MPISVERRPYGNEGDFPGGGSCRGAELGRPSFPWRVVIEKLPLLLLAAIFCGVTFWSQIDARAAKETLPLGWRIANALVSYAAYLEQFVYPVGLAIFYPHPAENLPIGKVFLAVAVLLLISTAAVACRRRCPYLLVGWLWFLGMLVPVIGLVQAGAQGMADRFTYLPQIGLCIALAWGAARRGPISGASSSHLRPHGELGAGGADGLGVASDLFLARQPDPLDPHPGLYIAK